MGMTVRLVLLVLGVALLVYLYLQKRRETASDDEPERGTGGELDPTDERRFVHIDQEELIEGSWDFFLPTLQRVLRAENVAFDAVVSNGDDVREVHLDGELLWRVTAEEVSEETATSGLVWLARAVNRRLEAAGSPQRFYFTDGWNDLGGTLLTPAEYDSLIAGKWAESLWSADDGLPVSAPIDVQHLLLAIGGPPVGARGGAMFYVRIPGDIGPIDRGRLYEDPLREALRAEGLGSVSGGGTQLGANGAIEYCGIDVAVTDRDRGLACVLRVMRELGAPEGTVVEESGPPLVEHAVWGQEGPSQLH